MPTKQNYVGGGCYASLTTQTVRNETEPAQKRVRRKREIKVYFRLRSGYANSNRPKNLIIRPTVDGITASDYDMQRVVNRQDAEIIRLHPVVIIEPFRLGMGGRCHE